MGADYNQHLGWGGGGACTEGPRGGEGTGGAAAPSAQAQLCSMFIHPLQGVGLGGRAMKKGALRRKFCRLSVRLSRALVSASGKWGRGSGGWPAGAWGLGLQPTPTPPSCRVQARQPAGPEESPSLPRPPPRPPPTSFLLLLLRAPTRQRRSVGTLSEPPPPPPPPPHNFCEEGGSGAGL